MGRKYGTWFLMRRTHDIMVQARNRELRQYGINLEYSGTLNLVLKLGKDATPGEIARWRYRRPHTVSEVLRSMERDGLVRRDRDAATPLLRVILHLTPF